MTVVLPECPGWETMIGYIFYLLPTDNTSLYSERSMTLSPQYAFQNVSDGNYLVIVKGQNTCEENTVLGEKPVLIGRSSLSPVELVYSLCCIPFRGQ